jgi:ABC-2 type transport system permease protein
VFDRVCGPDSQAIGLLTRLNPGVTIEILMTKSLSNTVYDSSVHRWPAIYELLQAWQYRDLIFHLVRRDVTARYKRSVLGIAWTMLNPLMMMIVLTIVFSQVWRSDIHGYSAYVLSGLIAWQFFTLASSSAINSLVWGGDLFQRIYVPRAVFAISAIGTGLVNLTLSLVPLIAVMLVIGVPIRLTAFLIIPAMLLLAGFTLGVGLFISTIGMYFPDVVEMYAVLLLAWFYVTPILYPITTLPEQVRTLLKLNPMLYLIELFRIPIFEGRVPLLSDWLIGTAVSLLTLLLGWIVFAWKSDEFAYRV